MDNDKLLVGRDGTRFPFIYKFRLPATTIEFSGHLPEELSPDDVHMCAAYDTQRWQPVKFEFRHKLGHTFYTLTFQEKLPASVEVAILRTDNRGSGGIDTWS